MNSETLLTNGRLARRDLGVLFPVCDEDERHFERFSVELARLGYPFAVHFDHCSESTEHFWRNHPLFLAGYSDNDPKSFFDESSRQSAMDLLVERGFERALQFDVDETLERDAPQKIRGLLDMPLSAWHVVFFPILDLWGTGDCYRVDGPFIGGGREKMFRLKGAKVRYPHPTSHAPYVTPDVPGEDGYGYHEHAKVIKAPVWILHWGVMSMDDVRFHTARWDRIYTRKVGGNPYGGYAYWNDPKTVLVTRPFDYSTWHNDTMGK